MIRLSIVFVWSKQPTLRYILILCGYAGISMYKLPWAYHGIWITIWWYRYRLDLFRARRLACSSSVLSIWITFFSLATSWLSEFFSTWHRAQKKSGDRQALWRMQGSKSNTLLFHSRICYTLHTKPQVDLVDNVLRSHCIGQPVDVVSALHQASQGISIWSFVSVDRSSPLYDPCHSLPHWFPLIKIHIALISRPQKYWRVIPLIPERNPLTFCFTNIFHYSDEVRPGTSYYFLINTSCYSTATSKSKKLILPTPSNSYDLPSSFIVRSPDSICRPLM